MFSKTPAIQNYILYCGDFDEFSETCTVVGVEETSVKTHESFDDRYGRN